MTPSVIRLAGDGGCHLRLAVPEKRCAHSFACVFRPLRKFRLRFFCHWQREAAIPPEGGGKRGIVGVLLPPWGEVPSAHTGE